MGHTQNSVGIFPWGGSATMFFCLSSFFALPLRPNDLIFNHLVNAGELMFTGSSE